MADLKISQLSTLVELSASIAVGSQIPMVVDIGAGILKTARVSMTELTAYLGGVIPLTVGTTPIASGVAGRVLFQGATNAVSQSANLFFDATNGRLSVRSGSSPTAVLDITASGSLVSDFAFKVVNSISTLDLFSIRGNGRVYFGNPVANNYIEPNGDFQLNGLFGYAALLGRIEHTVPIAHGGANNSTMFTTSNALNRRFNSLAGGSTLGFLVNFGNSNFRLGGNETTFSGTNLLSIENGTSPTTSVANAFYMYSADIVAGNAVPHFRTENGSIINLAQETTAVATATYVHVMGGNALHDTDTFDGYTVGQVVKSLRNRGLLA